MTKEQTKYCKTCMLWGPECKGDMRECHRTPAFNITGLRYTAGSITCDSWVPCEPLEKEGEK